MNYHYEHTVVYRCPNEKVIMDCGWPECPICGHTFVDADILKCRLKIMDKKSEDSP